MVIRDKRESSFTMNRTRKSAVAHSGPSSLAFAISIATFTYTRHDFRYEIAKNFISFRFHVQGGKMSTGVARVLLSCE